MQITRVLTGLAAFAASLALAGGAGAAPLKIDLQAVAAQTAPTPLPLDYRPTGPTLPEGIARTSVDHSFVRDGSQDYVGAAGLLCGLKPGDDSPGAAAAFGRDKDGKFLGAKFTIAF